ncbi:hypothetical protein ACQY0O_007593 [Thecaphora frezii]
MSALDPDDRILLLNARDIALLSSQIPLTSLLSNQAGVFRTLSSSPSSSPSGAGAASAASTPSQAPQCPPRVAISAAHHTVLFMPARAGANTSIKCVAVPHPTRPLPSGVPSGIPGTTLLFHPETSRLRAVVNASELTALRTAAGSVVATLLSIPPAAAGRAVRNLVVFGGGLQAFYHAWLLCRIYHGLERVTFALTRGDQPSASTQASVERLRKLLGDASSVQVEWSDSVEDRMRRADIVCCCTPSDKPLLDDEWVKDGTHINIVGAYKPHMVELPSALVQVAASTGSLLVDSIEACAKEAGDLLQAQISPSQMVELGTLVPPASSADDDWTKIDARPSSWKRRTGDEAGVDRGISIFKSVGVGLQDVAVTAMFVEEAEKRGVGQRVEFF